MARIAFIWVLQSHKQLGEDVVVMDVYKVDNPNQEDWIPEGRLRTISKPKTAALNCEQSPIRVVW